MWKFEIPQWVAFPEKDWGIITPKEAGINEARFNAFIANLQVRGADFGGEDHTGQNFGAVITRGGYLLHSWGNRNYRFQTASVGKAFMRVLVGIAVEDGLIDPDEPLQWWWTGENQLSHKHKYLNQGHHKTLTWNHLLGFKYGSEQHGGFPMETGVRWAEKRTGLLEQDTVYGVVPWAKWSGDASYDLYAHAEPGTVATYSSAGFWRLGQALTHVFNRDLREVLQERIFDQIGIPPEQWDWHTGEDLHTQRLFYPNIPDSYTYLDPPYQIGGHVVRGGPGWVIISASDLARYGHLIACRGIWNRQRIIAPEWLRGHGGGNKSGVSGESKTFTAMGVVTAMGIEHVHHTARESFLPSHLFEGAVAVN